MKDIVRATGVHPGSLYAAFSDTEAIFLKALQTHTAENVFGRMPRVARGPSAILISLTSLHADLRSDGTSRMFPGQRDRRPRSVQRGREGVYRCAPAHAEFGANSVARGVINPNCRAELIRNKALCAPLGAATAVKRVVEIDDVADVVAFPASDASGRVTGTLIDASGGWRL